MRQQYKKAADDATADRKRHDREEHFQQQHGGRAQDRHAKPKHRHTAERHARAAPGRADSDRRAREGDMVAGAKAGQGGMDAGGSGGGASRLHGRVKRFDTDRGYGFIAVKGQNDVYFRHTGVQNGGGGHLQPGTDVVFQMGERSGRPCAERVRPANVAPAEGNRASRRAEEVASRRARQQDAGNEHSRRSSPVGRRRSRSEERGAACDARKRHCGPASESGSRPRGER